jgi:hypothetical protein
MKWCYIEGYAEDYKLFENGQVWSNKRHIYLNDDVDKAGYHRVVLYYKSKRKRYLVHRLVAMVFKVSGAGPEVNHKDGNKSNNHYSNLEYVTPLQNVAHAISTGLTNQVGSNNPITKLTEDDVINIRNLVKTNTLQHVADLYKISRSTVKRIKYRIYWTHI